jgi:DNA-binding NarL/FixJ family response regulator
MTCQDVVTVDDPSPFTERDVELLHHLAAGRSTAQAAAAMSITSNTVRTRVRRIEGKLAVGDRAELVCRARQIGLV